MSLPNIDCGAFGDADVIALRLRHLVDAVEAFEQRHGEDALRLLPEVALQLASDEQVEFLVGAAELDVGLQGNRVVTLHQRVQELVDRDRLLAGEALGEVVPLEHARDGVLRGELDHARSAQGLAPLRVVANLGARRIEHLGGLRVVRPGVRLDLLARQRRAHVVAAGRVPDHRREVADEEDHLMPQVLHLAHLVEHNRVPEMDVGRRRVESQLDAQGPSSRELLRDLALDQELVGAPLEDSELFGDLGVVGTGGVRGGG